MPRKIQVSFQGGGAKIVNLLAAAEAIQQKCSSNEIEVSRIAGTSAGAIVASLLAFDVQISKLDSTFFSDILDTVRDAPGIDRLAGDGWMDKGGQLLAIANGEPFIETGYLKTIIEKVLAVLGVDPDTIVRDVPKPIFIGAASQVSRRAEYFHQSCEELGDYKLSDALVASTKIPFVFTNFKSDGDLAHAFVDGGLCENLPVEPLLEGKGEFGPVLAIGVTSQSGDWPATNAKQYIGQLFDIAINNSVKRAERYVGAENVHRVVADVATTEFVNLSPTFRLEDNYNRTLGSCARWLEKRLQAMDAASEATIEVPSEPTAHDLLEQNARAFEARLGDRKYEIDYAALIATPHSWKTRYEEVIKGGETDVYSRVHLVPRQASFELQEYPIGTTAIDGSLTAPPTLNVQIVQADGRRRPAKYSIIQYSHEGVLFGYHRKMVKSVVVLEEPLTKSTDQISSEQADKLLIWYQQDRDVIFRDLVDSDEVPESLGLYLVPGISALISKVYLLICGDAEKAGVKISVDDQSCELSQVQSVGDLPAELAYVCDSNVPFHGWESGEIKSGQGARLCLVNAKQ